MILETGKDQYPLPEFSEIRWSAIRFPDMDYAMIEISPVDWDKLRHDKEPPRSLRAMPTCFAIIRGESIGIYPAPDQDYEMVISYAPPLRLF